MQLFLFWFQFAPLHITTSVSDPASATRIVEQRLRQQQYQQLQQHLRQQQLYLALEFFPDLEQFSCKLELPFERAYHDTDPCRTHDYERWRYVDIFFWGVGAQWA